MHIYLHAQTYTPATPPSFLLLVADMSRMDSEAIAAVVSQLPHSGDHILPFSFPKYVDSSTTSETVSYLTLEAKEGAYHVTISLYVHTNVCMDTTF